MGRSPCCSKEGLNRGAWTALEDKILTSYINVHGEGKWRNLPQKAGLKRCGKSCRLRWLNYLRPDIKRGNISNDEEELIIRLHNLLGNRWSLIAGRLPGRTDNEIKNYWNTILRKKVKSQSTTKSMVEKLQAVEVYNKGEPSDSSSAMANQIQVVRTKARRWTKVVIPTMEEHSNETSIHFNATETAIDPLNIQVEGQDWNVDGNCENVRSLGGDITDQPFGEREAVVNDWNVYGNCSEENGSFDLDFLAFALGSEDWP